MYQLRPPRPGGIAQASKPATSLETNPTVPPSVKGKFGSLAAIAASSYMSQLPSYKTAQEEEKET